MVCRLILPDREREQAERGIELNTDRFRACQLAKHLVFKLDFRSHPLDNNQGHIIHLFGSFGE